MQYKKLDARLEIRLHPEQLQKLKEEAAEKKTSVGNLVREAIDQHYVMSTEKKLRAIEQLTQINAPVTNWEQMKKEIEAGYLKK